MSSLTQSFRSKIQARPVVLAAAVLGTTIATSAMGQIAYVTTEQVGQPVAVYYRDAGAWNYAGLLGVGSIDQTYGIARVGNEFILTESQGANRVMKMSLDGVVSPLATPLTSANFKGTSSVAPSLQSVVLAPDNKLYYGTAFGTPAGNGIWRSNADGSGLEQIIPSSLIGGTNWNIRDLSIADVDGNPANGFDVYFGTRGGFSDANRPYYHFNVNGATVTNVETLTTTAASPSTVLYDSTTNKVYLGKTNGGAYQVASVNPTGSGQTPATVYNASQVAFDLFKIGNDVFTLSADAGGAGTFRYVTGGAAGTVYLDMVAVSGGANLTGRQVAVIDPSELTSVTWDGGAANNNLSSNANYVGDTAPNYSGTAGFAPRVVFAGSTRLNPSNDVVGGRIGSVTFDATAGAFTLGGNGFTIPIAGGVTNLSTATQTLSTSSPITITGGSINAAAGAIVLNSDVTVATNGLMTLAGVNDITFNGKVSGSGNIDKSNTGALNLNNSANDFTGRLAINRGKLIVNSASSQSGLGAAGSTLAVGGGANDGVIELSNNVSITKTITLNGRTAQPAPAAADTFLPHLRNVSGSNSVETLILNATSSGVVQSDAGTLSINTVENRNGTTGATVFRVQGSGNSAITGQIGGGTSSGTLSIIKSGTGTLNVSAAYGSGNGVTNIGGYVIQGGTVAVSSVVPSSASRATTIQVDAAGTFDATSVGTYDALPGQVFSGTGILKVNTLNIYEDNVVRPGDTSDTGRVGTLKVQGNLQVANAFGAVPQQGLFFDIASSPAATGDRINVSGDLSLSSSAGAIPVNIVGLGGTFASGSYRLIDVAGSINGGSSSFAVAANGGAANYRQSFAVDASGTPNQVNLVVSGSAKTLVWKGDGAATADRFDVKNSANFLDGANPEQFFLGDTVQFVDDAAADHTVNLAGPIIGRVEYNSSQDYTLKNVLDYDTGTAGNQNGGFADGTTIVKNGSGTLTLDSTAAAPAWFGSIVINEGVFNGIGTNGGLGSTPFGLGVLGHATGVVLNGGTWRVNGGTSNRTFTLGANGGTIETATAGSSLGAAAGVVQFVGDGDRTLTVTGTQTLTFGGIINNPTVGVVNIVKNGVGSFSLNNAHSYSGTLTVNSGRMNINNVGGLGSAAGGTTVNSGGGLYVLAGVGSFSSAEPLSIAGVGPTFAAGPEASGALRIGNANSNVTFTGPVTVAADANFAIDDSSSSLTFAGNVSGPGALTKVGGGGRVTFGGGATGSLRIGGALTINNGRAVLNTPANVANKVAGLTLAATSSLDMVKSKLVIDYAAGNSPIASLNASLTTGLNGGTWDGNGIRSSFVAANGAYGIGIVEASDALNGSTEYFGLTGLDDSAVIVAVTLRGDSNVNGVVNFDDLLVLAQNYNGAGSKSWSNGDTNYDAVVNFDDLLALAQNYNQSALADVSQLTAVAGEGFASDWAMAMSLAPEPTTGLLVGLAGMAMARRRRCEA